MDFKTMLEGATGLPTEEIVFRKPQKLPFIIFIDKQQAMGDDYNTRLIAHDLTVEFYAERIDKEHEEKMEKLFKDENWKYTRERQWLEDQKCFVTVFEIVKFYEKIQKG